MRVLITGGFGYIGGRLAQYLLFQTNNEIFLGTRQQTTSAGWVPEAKVVQTIWDSLVQLEDICASMDVVVHTAGINAKDCAVDPIAALEFNGVATARLLQAAIRKSVQRFIYLSTAHVYANPLSGTITEDTCPTNLHPYATSHRAGEDVVLAAHQRREIEGIVIRISNSYGAPEHKDVNCWMLLVNDLCRQAVMNQKMILRSSGLQRRDFVPLTDVCSAINHLLKVTRRETGNNLYNVGRQWAPTVWEVACLVQERCKEVLGFQPHLTRVLPQPDEISPNLDYRIDALRQTGFQPIADITGEIDRVLKFCEESFTLS